MLCSLAAIYAVLVSFVFVWKIPDPIFHPDSFSYLEPAFSFLYKHSYAAVIYRTPGYAFFLTVLLAISGSFRMVVMAQHGLAIATGVLAGIIAMRHARCSLWTGVWVALFSSLMPQTLLASQSILTETLYSFCAVLSLYFFMEAYDRNRSWAWCGLGLTTTAALLTRPVGWSLILGICLTLLLFRNKMRLRRGATLAVAIFLAGAGSYAACNFYHQGFFGIDQFAGLSILGSTARYIDPSRLPNPIVRQTLAPLYETAEQRAFLTDDNWVRYAPQGPARLLALKFPSSLQLNSLFKKLAWEGMTNHPFLFLTDQGLRAFAFISTRSAIPAIDCQPSFTFFIYRGLILYDRWTKAYPQARSLVAHSVADFSSYYEKFGLIEHLSDHDAQPLLQTLEATDLFQYGTILHLDAPFMACAPLMRYIPWLALGFAVYLFKTSPALRPLVGLLLSVMAGHILLTTLGGDNDGRHALPLEPFYWILFWVGIEKLRRVI